MNANRTFSIKNIGILGTGAMGGAILRGLSAHLSREQILAYDPFPDEGLRELASYADAPEMLEDAEVILICTKPQVLRSSVRPFTGKSRYISIAAGVSTQTLRGAISGVSGKRIARVMPNLGASIGASTSAVYAEDEELRNIAVEIFSCIGSVEVLPDEDLMHAFTALCGSGPAFVFAFVQGLAEGGVRAGLSYDASLRLALSTTAGSVRLLEELGTHPAVLRNRVTSPAGTTIAGLERLESHGFQAALMDAVWTASLRSRELEK